MVGNVVGAKMGVDHNHSAPDATTTKNESLSLSNPPSFTTFSPVVETKMAIEF